MICTYIYIYARIVRLCSGPKFFHAISNPLCSLHDNKCNHFCRSQHFAHSSTHCWNQGQNEYSTGKMKVFALHGSFPLPDLIAGTTQPQKSKILNHFDVRGSCLKWDWISKFFDSWTKVKIASAKACNPTHLPLWSRPRHGLREEKGGCEQVWANSKLRSLVYIHNWQSFMISFSMLARCHMMPQVCWNGWVCLDHSRRCQSWNFRVSPKVSCLPFLLPTSPAPPLKLPQLRADPKMCFHAMEEKKLCFFQVSVIQLFWDIWDWVPLQIKFLKSCSSSCH